MAEDKLSREKMLSLLGLDYTITKAENQYVYIEKENGETAEVLDLISGYGSNLFGHYYEPFVNTLQETIKSKIPVFTQLSTRKTSDELKAELSRIAFEETGQHYKAILLNTGTESVEAAMKHALLAYEKKKSAWIDKKIKNYQRKEINSKAEFNPNEINHSKKTLQNWEENIRQILDEQQPVFLALKRAYHGKTLGSLSLTAQEKWRRSFGNSAYKTFFVDLDGIDIESIKNSFQIHLPLPGKTETEAWLPFAGFFAEPLQGEGGVFPLSEKQAAYIQTLKNALNIPLIWDEIQSGSYRCGKLFYASNFNVHGDYYLLGKALGGGLMKISALMIREDLYDPEFSLLHTSTFAEDELSSSVSIRFLKEAESKKSKIASIENTWKSELEKIKTEFPDVISAIRGDGLMYGIEIRKYYKSGSYGLQALSRSGYFNYMLAAWLFHNHQIRISAPLSNDHTLRIHPPINCNATDIKKFCNAIRHLCDVLRKVDFYGLISFMLPEKWQNLRQWPQGFYTEDVIWEEPLENAPKAGFLTHYIDNTTITAADESLACLPNEAQEFLLYKFLDVLPPIVTGQRNIYLEENNIIHLSMVGLPFTSAMAKKALKTHEIDRFRDKVIQGALFLEERNTNVIGLGQYNSILTLNGRTLPFCKAIITTGNGYTAYLTIKALLHQCEESGFNAENENLAIIGAAGNIGSIAAYMLLPHVKSVCLLGSDNEESYHKLYELKEKIADEFPEQSYKIQIRRLENIKDCRLVLVATNHPEAFIKEKYLHPQAIVCDVSVPANICKYVINNPGDRSIFYGGIANLPDHKPLPIKGFPLDAGFIYGCLAETLILTSSGNESLTSTGILQQGNVMALGDLGEALGFSIAGIKNEALIQ
jgi:acetylornithine/succinyldiaminopimelate/putrescine aminotransferase/predicted amino acid dehydrogenase